MKLYKYLQAAVLLAALFVCRRADGQPHVDTSYIKLFTRQNVLEMYPGIYKTHFNFVSKGKAKSNYKLAANSSGYFGVYFNYKWLSLSYDVNMPGTQLDRYEKFKYASLNLSFGTRQHIFRPYFDIYNGLLIPGAKRHTYDPFRGISITDAGIDYYFIASTKKFSFRAANYFSETQVKSAGSLFAMGTPLWQKITWKKPTVQLIPDTATYRLLSSNPEWYSFIARLGYSYNFVFNHGQWLVSPTVMVGGGGVRSTKASQEGLAPATDVQAWINAGYNGPTWYTYLYAGIDNLQTNFFIKNIHQVKSDITLTMGYRFSNTKKKVLGVL